MTAVFVAMKRNEIWFKYLSMYELVVEATSTPDICKTSNISIGLGPKWTQFAW